MSFYDSVFRRRPSSFIIKCLHSYAIFSSSAKVGYRAFHCRIKFAFFNGLVDVMVLRVQYFMSHIITSDFSMSAG
ncbi:hypothetical protein X975_26273, partial [Stegodyphus mimosarum]